MDSPLAASVLSALLAHQIFRRHETCSFVAHASLLLLPPLAVAVFSTSRNPTWSTLHTLLLSLPTYLLALASSVVLYRLSPFHPLARYPGPAPCKISKLWMAFKCLPGMQHKYIKALHHRYGDVVRIGPNELSIRDASAIGPILGASGIPKGPNLRARVMSEKSLSMIGLQDPDVHLQRRRVWARGFTPSVVKDYEGLVVKRVKQLVHQLERQHGQVRLDQWLNYMSFDIMSDMAFGGGSELLSGKEGKHFWSVLEDAMCLATFFGHVPWLSFHVGHIPFAAAPLKTLLTNAQELTRQRIERGAMQPDLFHYLSGEDVADVDPDKARPSMQQLVDDGILAVVAGADTVASASTSLFCCLLTYPDVYARLQEEIDRFYPPGEDPLDSKHYRDMPYLNAVINETLRLLPPVPGCTQREVPRTGPGVVAGESIYIPPGTSVWVHAYSIHRDPRNFSPAPEAFWPERWLATSDSESEGSPSAPPPNADSSEKKGTFVRNDAAFVPFSHGPMNCVGKSVALQEMRAVVCAVLHRFRVRPADGFGGLRAYEEEARDYFVATRGRVPAVLEVRGVV